MQLEEKVNQIEKFLEDKRHHKIVVWGAGLHTEKLFKYTSLLSFQDLEITDSNKAGIFFFGKRVSAVEEICWKNVDYIFISSFQY